MKKVILSALLILVLVISCACSNTLKSSGSKESSNDPTEAETVSSIKNSPEEVFDVVLTEINKYYKNETDPTIGNDVAPFYYFYVYSKPEYQQEAVDSVPEILNYLCDLSFNYRLVETEDEAYDEPINEGIAFDGCCGSDAVITGNLAELRESSDGVSDSEMQEMFDSQPCRGAWDRDKLNNPPVFSAYRTYQCDFTITGSGKTYEWSSYIDFVKTDDGWQLFCFFGW